MDFFIKGIDVMQMIVIAIGGGTTAWGLIQLFQANTNDNPGSRNTGISFFIAGAGIMAVGVVLIPELKTLISF